MLVCLVGARLWHGLTWSGRHISIIPLSLSLSEEELFMQELEEERERQMREVEEALFLEEYQNQA